MSKKVKFEIIRSSFGSWESLFDQAANIATLIGPERLISISHSEDQSSGVVTIWYWSDAETDVLGLNETREV